MIIPKAKNINTPKKKEAPTINLQLTNDQLLILDELLVDCWLTAGGLLVGMMN